MKRFITVSTATLATAACLGMAAPAANADAGVRVNAHAQVALAHQVAQQVANLDARLARVENSASVQHLDADVRAEVTANIEADQSALADLSVEAKSADTVAEVRAVLNQVNDYRPAVYAEVTATLTAADRLEGKIDTARESLDLTGTLLALLDDSDASLDAAVEGSLSLDATSDQSDVREVKVDLHAAVTAYAKATN